LGLAQKHLWKEDTYAALKIGGAAVAAGIFAPPVIDKVFALQHMSHAFDGSIATGFLVTGLAMSVGIDRVMTPVLAYGREKKFSSWLRNEVLTHDNLKHLGEASSSDELDLMAEAFIDGLVEQGKRMKHLGRNYSEREIYGFIGDNSRDNPHDVVDNELRTAFKELRKKGATALELVGIGRAVQVAEREYELSRSGDLMENRNRGKRITITMPDEHDMTEMVQKRGILEKVYRDEERLVVRLRTAEGVEDIAVTPGGGPEATIEEEGKENSKLLRRLFIEAHKPNDALLKRALIDPFHAQRRFEALRKRLGERDDHGRLKMPLLKRAVANDFYDLFDRGFLAWAESRDMENELLIWLDNRRGYHRLYAKPLRIALNAVHLVTLRLPVAVIRGPITSVADAIFVDRWKRTKKYLGMKEEKAELKDNPFGLVRKFGGYVDSWPWEFRRPTQIGYNLLHRIAFNNVAKIALGYLAASNVNHLLTYCGASYELRDALCVAGGAGGYYLAKDRAKIKSAFTRMPRAAAGESN
jgi:hypothetical protein